jgi:peptidyl-prolyl cis-trans isomerase D
VQAVFKMPVPNAEPTSELVTLANGDVSLVALNKVYAAPIGDITQQERDGITRQQVNKHYESFIKALEQKADVTTTAVVMQEPNL